MGPHVVWIILGLVVGGALALAGLFRPFLGVLILQIVGQNRHLPARLSNPLVELNYQVASTCGAMLIALIAASLVSHTLYGPYWYFLAGFAAANSSNARACTEGEAATEENSSLIAGLTPREVVVDERPALPRV